MYSGSTLTNYSGQMLGVHQKFDRVSRRHLARLMPDNDLFPSSKSILMFEGRDGPDGIKRKSPAKDELWHYYNPFDEADRGIIDIIDEHYAKLVDELKQNNQERTAFEASWLAHALVDGLTPAHHYPYEEKLVELRGGEGLETRTTTKDKLVLPGDNRREKVKNNWKFWGPKGLFMAHGLFELGVAAIVKPLTFNQALPSDQEIHDFREKGLEAYFQQCAREIAVMDMYHNFIKKGWTPKLVKEVRQKLGPIMVRIVTLAWYSALLDAELVKEA